jgi:hypothetical protein
MPPSTLGFWDSTTSQIVPQQATFHTKSYKVINIKLISTNTCSKKKLAAKSKLRDETNHNKWRCLHVVGLPFLCCFL